MRAALIAAVIPLLTSCGGRTALVFVDNGGAGGAPSSSSASTGGDGGSGGVVQHPPCVSADGIRLCGGSDECPWLSAPECPGYGCTSTIELYSSAESKAGVCWADLIDNGSNPCIACKDGEACVYRAPDRLICVSLEVCEALWDMGETNVCRYADKRAYDHQPLPAPTGPCPTSWYLTLCGGECGDCDGMIATCTGRSAGRPFGLCIPKTSNGQHATCELNADGQIIQWCQSTPFAAVCAVFDVPDADVAEARHYGVCMERNLCTAAAASMPGGLHCYDETGKQL